MHAIRNHNPPSSPLPKSPFLSSKISRNPHNRSHTRSSMSTNKRSLTTPQSPHNLLTLPPLQPIIKHHRLNHYLHPHAPRCEGGVHFDMLLNITYPLIPLADLLPSARKYTSLSPPSNARGRHHAIYKEHESFVQSSP